MSYLPAGVERALATYVPVVLTIAGPDSASVEVVLFFGVFAVLGLVYGTYEIGRALTETEYSIHLGRSGV